MDCPVPDDWLCDPPQTLVVGRGAYAFALTQVLEADLTVCDALVVGPEPNAAGGYPRALDDLERVFLVLGTSQSPAEALHCHEALWNWVSKLTSNGDQHELAIVFVLPQVASREFEEALTLGLCVPPINPQTTGHAVVRMGDSLESLVNIARSILPRDLLQLNARRAANQRYAVLTDLLASKNSEALEAAAWQVLEVFRDCEYHLDIFCAPPSHANGNSLRKWLSQLVTNSVTPEWYDTGRSELPNWIG